MPTNGDQPTLFQKRAALWGSEDLGRFGRFDDLGKKRKRLIENEGDDDFTGVDVSEGKGFMYDSDENNDKSMVDEKSVGRY